jgi:hypothetical protein
MKKNKSIIIAVLLLWCTSSCKKDFLSVRDNSNLNRQSYVKDLNTLDEFMNGVYVMMSAFYESYQVEAYSELVADNLKPSSSSRPLALHYNWSQQADANTLVTYNSSMNQTWKEHYQIIRASNFVIEEVDKYRNENPEKADLIKGKAFAARALVHFRLVNLFSQSYRFTPEASHPGIPYILTSDIKAPYSRQTVAEVYDYLIVDFTKAIALLPSSMTDTRIMNKATAKALLARAYLFKEDYENAKSLSAELAQQYPLMKISEGYPNDLFKNRPSSQTEILFQVTPIYDNEIQSAFIGLLFQVNFYWATEDIATILQENSNDVRSSWVSSAVGQRKVQKFPGGVAGIHPTASSDYYVPIIRSSEMFLIAAEAFAKTGDEVSALNYLNAIRQRADPSIGNVAATGQALLDSIYKERRKELCFEGFRMFDIQRWQKSVQRTDVLPGNQTILPYRSDKAIAPIPVSDVKLAGLIQNQGY